MILYIRDSPKTLVGFLFTTRKHIEKDIMGTLIYNGIKIIEHFEIY